MFGENSCLARVGSCQAGFNSNQARHSPRSIGISDHFGISWGFLRRLEGGSGPQGRRAGPHHQFTNNSLSASECIINSLKAAPNRALGRLGASWGALGAYWSHLGVVWVRLGTSGCRFGSVLKASWGILVCLDFLGAVQACPGGVTRGRKQISTYIDK